MTDVTWTLGRECEIKPEYTLHDCLFLVPKWGGIKGCCNVGQSSINSSHVDSGYPCKIQKIKLNVSTTYRNKHASVLWVIPKEKVLIKK